MHSFQVINLYIQGISFVSLAWLLYCIESLHLPGHPIDNPGASGEGILLIYIVGNVTFTEIAYFWNV
jgi:hypothetical protein